MSTLDGGCHCGNLRFALETGIDPATMVPRACDCGFCRRHATRALSDPAGRLRIAVADAGALGRYRFGTGFTDFLICRNCGVYIGAFMPDGPAAADGEAGFANVMANALDAPQAIVHNAVTVHRSSEDADAKRARRRAQWTPATLVISG
jgi:hypothetical protein